jgi:hypothetical protein
VNPFDPFIMWWYAWWLQTSAAEFWVRSSYLVARELWLPRGARRERTGKGLAQMYWATLRDTYGADEDNVKGAS